MPRIEHTAIEFFHNDDPSVTPEEWKEQMEFIPDLLDVITEMLPIGHPETANVKAIAERIRKEEKMAVYVLEERVRSKGWELIASTPVQGDGVQAPGFVTLCYIPGAHPYVVHFLNVQDGGFHSGDYFKDDVSARRAYAARAERYTRHHRSA